MGKESLLPCPFCGKQPIWVNLVNPNGQHTLKCVECQFSMSFDRKDKTIGYWNRRESNKSISTCDNSKVHYFSEQEIFDYEKAVKTFEFTGSLLEWMESQKENTPCSCGLSNGDHKIGCEIVDREMKIKQKPVVVEKIINNGTESRYVFVYPNGVEIDLIESEKLYNEVFEKYKKSRNTLKEISKWKSHTTISDSNEIINFYREKAKKALGDLKK